MFRLLERHRTAIVIFLAVALPLAIYRANARDPANTRVLDRVILAATAPIQRGITRAVGWVSDTWYAYVDVVDARKESAELRRRLYSAERKNDELAAVALENEHLLEVLEIKTRNPKIETVQASVIAAGTSPLARTIEIDRGATAHVARGMVVLSDAGLVGLVTRVGWTSSEVMLIADEKLTIAALDARSRARGRLKGAGLKDGFGLELTEVLRSDDVRVGDRVATSGLGGVFPRGLPIGEIRHVRTPTGAAHRIADVEPYVDFARLEEVMVLVTAPKDEPFVTPEDLRPPELRTPEDGGPADARAGPHRPSEMGDGGRTRGNDGGPSDGGPRTDGGRRGRDRDGGPAPDGGGDGGRARRRDRDSGLPGGAEPLPGDAGAGERPEVPKLPSPELGDAGT